ncbi:uncharacterized protein [Drosophila takahashii]|uniref:uncharacterized protein n=1 Tax=Drosophila takahashii TaxID=29030 RepID=UPI0038996DB2
MGYGGEPGESFRSFDGDGWATRTPHDTGLKGPKTENRDEGAERNLTQNWNSNSNWDWDLKCLKWKSTVAQDSKGSAVLVLHCDPCGIPGHFRKLRSRGIRTSTVWRRALLLVPFLDIKDGNNGGQNFLTFG